MIVSVLAGAVALAAESGNFATLENVRLRIEYDLEAGRYTVTDRRTGEEVIRQASYTINGLSSTDPALVHRHETRRFEDSLGVGEVLVIRSSGESLDTLIYEIALYEEAGFFALNWGLINRGETPLSVKRAVVLEGQAYSGSAFADYKVLDGESNDFQTRVWEQDTVSSKNNLLVTFGARGEPKQSLVMGGLTYHEFEKFAKVVRQADRLELSLWSEDPVGKRIDPGATFVSQDRFMVDFSIDNRFELLEAYGRRLAVANQVDISGVDFPILNFWYAYVDKFGNDAFKNNSTGTLEMLLEAYKTGFDKYAKLGIRLEPDDYAEPNNQQGWWDDAHWQAYEHGQLLPPLDTMEKWGHAILEAGGVPFLYFQTARRSEDYAIAHPGHMLFNETHAERSNGMGGWWEDGNRYWGYDFTDPGFVRHMEAVYAYLKRSGIKGIKYDYPFTGWAYDGGMEDPYATTAGAYRAIFRLAYEGLGPGCDIHERMGPSDITLGVITTQRTEGDNDIVIPPMTAKTGLRWYKNRVVYHCDQDARNPYRAHPEPVRYAWQTMYTMTYVTSGRMEIGKYLHKMTPEMLHDLSRVVPLHQAAQSARPVDAFSGKEFPEIYDFKVNDDWHLLTFYNTKWTGDKWPESWSDRLKEFPGEMIPGTVSLNLADATDEGGLGLDPAATYYVWDFWNERLVGEFAGDATLSQDLRAGEARMMALHRKLAVPQFLSTNRHLMQGYVDFSVYPVWQEAHRTLAGASIVPADEDYKIILAANGFEPAQVAASSGKASWSWIDAANGLFEVTLRSAASEEVEWSISFQQPSEPAR